MADLKAGEMNQTGSGTSHSFAKAAATAKNATDQAKSVVEQAASVGRDLKEKAQDLAGSSTDAIKDHASEFVDAAKDVASQATDKFKQTVDGQKAAGAEYVGSLADTMRRAAREFDSDLPIAGSYIRKAASQVEGVADTIKTGNFNDLVRGAQSFARRQPTAFLGLAVLAGFGAVRFLKSSSSESGSASTGGGESRSRVIHSPNKSSENKGYRDDFTR